MLALYFLTGLYQGLDFLNVLHPVLTKKCTETVGEKKKNPLLSNNSSGPELVYVWKAELSSAYS